MTRPDEPIALETLLGDDGLDVRTRRIERGVRARLGRAPGPMTALLTQPALAAAAVIACVVVRLAVGGAPAFGSGGPDDAAVEQITITETSLGEMLPLWLREN